MAPAVQLMPWQNATNDSLNASSLFTSVKGKTVRSAISDTSIRVEKTNSLFSSSTPSDAPLVFNKNGTLATQTAVTPVIRATSTKKKHPCLIVPERVLREASETLDDPFWVSTLANAADGKWPRGFKFRNGLLLYQFKNKVFECPIRDEMAPADVARDVVNFIRAHTSQQSERDRERDRQLLETNHASQCVSRWNNKNAWNNARARGFFISNYIDRMCAANKLNYSEKMQLIDVLRYGLVMNIINKNCIIFSDKNDANIEIETIQTLVFDSVQRIWNTVKPNAPVKRNGAKKSIPPEEPKVDDYPLTDEHPAPVNTVSLSYIVKSIKERIKAMWIEEHNNGKKESVPSAETILFTPFS